MEIPRSRVVLGVQLDDSRMINSLARSRVYPRVLHARSIPKTHCDHGESNFPVRLPATHRGAIHVNLVYSWQTRDTRFGKFFNPTGVVVACTISLDRLPITRFSFRDPPVRGRVEESQVGEESFKWLGMRFEDMNRGWTSSSAEVRRTNLLILVRVWCLYEISRKFVCLPSKNLDPPLGYSLLSLTPSL